MKKKTSFIFILLANINILAHLVMPHHNHLFVEEECHITCHIENTTNKSCPHNDTLKINSQSEEENSHHGLNFEDCLLEEIHIRIDEINQITQAAYIGLQNHTLVQNEILIISEPFEEPLIFNIKKDLPPIKDPDFVRDTGLRAPPFC